jgi:hypothetical protein
VADERVTSRFCCPRCGAVFLVGRQPVVEDELPEVPPEEAIRAAPPRGAVPGRLPPEETPEPRRRRRTTWDDDFGPRRRRPRGRDDGDWGKVKIGLTFVLAALGLTAVGLLLVLTGVLLFGSAAFSAFSALSARRDVGGGEVAGLGGGLVLFFTSAAVLFIGQGLSLTGQILCIFAPSREGAKVLAIVAVSLAGLSLLLSCANGLASMPRSGDSVYSSGGGGGLGLVRVVVDFAQDIVFLFLLRALALALRRHDVAEGVVQLLIGKLIGGVLGFMLVCAGILLGGAFVMRLFRGQEAGGGMPETGGAYIVGAVVLGGLLFFLWAALFLWHVFTVWRVRDAVAQRVA